MQIKHLLEINEIEMEILPLYNYEIKECIGCDCCVLNGKCVLSDEASELMDKIAKADGIIVASPVYLQQVSGKMKTFFDRTCQWYHRPVLTAKPVLAVATTKGSGLKATLQYIQNVSTQWGAITAGTVGRTIFTQDKPVTSKEVSRFISLLNNPNIYSPSLNQLIGFEVQKSLSQHLDGLDLKYWQKMKWVSEPYFYKCRVNVFKKLISEAIGNIMRKNMSKKVSLQDVLEHDKKAE